MLQTIRNHTKRAPDALPSSSSSTTGANGAQPKERTKRVKLSSTFAGHNDATSSTSHASSNSTADSTRMPFIGPLPLEAGTAQRAEQGEDDSQKGESTVATEKLEEKLEPPSIKISLANYANIVSSSIHMVQTLQRTVCLVDDTTLEALAMNDVFSNALSVLIADVTCARNLSTASKALHILSDLSSTCLSESIGDRFVAEFPRLLRESSVLTTLPLLVLIRNYVAVGPTRREKALSSGIDKDLLETVPSWIYGFIEARKLSKSIRITAIHPSVRSQYRIEEEEAVTDRQRFVETLALAMETLCLLCRDRYLGTIDESFQDMRKQFVSVCCFVLNYLFSHAMRTEALSSQPLLLKSRLRALQFTLWTLAELFASPHNTTLSEEERHIFLSSGVLLILGDVLVLDSQKGSTSEGDRIIDHSLVELTRPVTQAATCFTETLLQVLKGGEVDEEFRRELLSNDLYNSVRHLLSRLPQNNPSNPSERENPEEVDVETGRALCRIVKLLCSFSSVYANSCVYHHFDGPLCRTLRANCKELHEEVLDALAHIVNCTSDRFRNTIASHGTVIKTLGDIVTSEVDTKESSFSLPNEVSQTQSSQSRKSYSLAVVVVGIKMFQRMYELGMNQSKRLQRPYVKGKEDILPRLQFSILKLTHAIPLTFLMGGIQRLSKDTAIGRFQSSCIYEPRLLPYILDLVDPIPAMLLKLYRRLSPALFPTLIEQVFKPTEEVEEELSIAQTRLLFLQTLKESRETLARELPRSSRSSTYAHGMHPYRRGRRGRGGRVRGTGRAGPSLRPSAIPDFWPRRQGLWRHNHPKKDRNFLFA